MPTCISLAKARAGQMEGRDHEQADHGGRRTPAKVLQQRMLHPPLEQVRRCGRQRPRHQENAERRRDGPGESCRPIAQKRHGNEHGTGRDVAEGDRRGEILRH